MTSKLLAGVSLILWLAVLGPGGCGADDPTPLAPHQDLYLHVSTTGSSANDGTADSPLLLPNAAFQRAFLEGYRGVRLAAGQYVSYSSNLSMRLYGGVDVIGGCDPETWQPVPGEFSRLTSANWPLRGLGIRTPTLVQGLDMYGAPTQFGTSSTALYLDSCGPELRFEHCRFTAQEGRFFGKSAGDGSPPNEPTGPRAGGLGSCSEEIIASGGQSGTDGCPGGRGGEGGLPGQAGQDGRLGCGYYGLEYTPGGEPGLDGADGRDGDDGQDGVNAELPDRLGTLRQYSLMPSDEAWGHTGDAGQGGDGGGGGGGSATGTGNGGGGGGTGGYRGNRGQGGPNGGHSVAAICINSTSVFRHCLFTADSGGHGSDGGNGAAGASGTPGAPGGDACPGEVGRGGHGGAGGHGGGGGGGAGGHGGVSYGMLVLGSVRPDTDKACVFVAAAPSAPGLGGQNGNGLSHAPDGLPGEALGLKIIPIPGEVLSID